MSADFEKVLVKDPRLDVTDAIKYAVIKGGQNVTMVKYPAVAYSNSQLVWNVQVPSEQTIIDRRVLLNATVDVNVTVTAYDGATGIQNGIVCYGVNAALASFPLHQCMTTLSATINNNTVTCNIDDVLPAVIRLLNSEDLVYHNSYSPAFCDIVGRFYTEELLSSYDYLSNSNTALWACTSREDWHRGAFPLKAANQALSHDGAIKLTYELTEPLLLSPFMFSKTKANNQGFYGIQNMNIVANLNNGARIFRGPSSGAATFANISGTGAEKSGIGAVTVDFTQEKPNLLMVFLTPHPSDLMPARNIVPYYELPRYINGGQPSIAGGTVTNGAFAYGASTKLTFNSIQLNQIPDKLIVFVRHTKSQDKPWGVPDVALPINQISINFNNNSGILASAQNQQLWEMSKNNGANTNWAEWYGIAQSVNQRGNQAAGTTAPTVAPVPLSGSYLVLEFGKDIQLTEDFYSCGSLGNFNLQMDVYAANNTIYNAASGDVELVVITMNSGVFVCERGTSATYTGILTKQDVLECSAQEYYTHDDVKRMVGGGFWDSIKSGVSSLAKKGMEMGKAHLRKHGKAYMQQGLKMAANTGKKMLKKYTEPAEEEE
jgi:hypothetical protein